MALETSSPTAINQHMDSDPMLKMICARVSKERSMLPGHATERDLKQRYGSVLAGFEFLSTKAHIDTYLIDFEDALRDLQVCTSCRTASAVLLPERDRTPWRHYIITGCPLESHGHPGFYYALSRRDSYRTQRPVFAYHECPGPVGRMKVFAERWRWKGDEA